MSTAWQLDAYRLDLPLVTHPTDAVVSPATAIAVGRLGGLGVLNAEGLWARHPDAEKALADVAARAATDPADAVAELQRLHAAPVQAGLITEALEQVRAAGVTVAARVSPQHARELTPTLLSAGVEVLVVQGTIISAEHVDGGQDAERGGAEGAAPGGETPSTSRTSSTRSTSRSWRAASATTAPRCTSCAPARPGDRRLRGVPRRRPPTPCSASVSRWPPRSSTWRPRAGTTSTRPAGATST